MSILSLASKLTRLEKLATQQRATAQAKTLRPAVDVLRWKDDFTGFAETLLDIVNADGIRQRLKRNWIQGAFEIKRSGRDIVLKPRQVGLTTWELARDVWFFLTRPNATVVVVVQSDKDHNALRDANAKLRTMFEALAERGVNLDFRTETISEWTRGGARLRIVEAGASVAAAQKKGRGGTVHRLHISELAFFEYAGATLNALLACVAPRTSGSEITIESTANGTGGLFFARYQQAKEGRGEYRKHFFRWTSEARYKLPLEPGEVLTPQTDREEELVKRYGATQEQLKWYRLQVEDRGQLLVDQEFPIDEETCWLADGRMFFDRARTLQLRKGAHEPMLVELGGALRVWKQQEPFAKYLIAVDPSEGDEAKDDREANDPGAAIVYNRATGEHVATLHGYFPPWRLAELVVVVATVYNQAEIVVERNNHGHAVIQALLMPPADANRKPYPHVYRAQDGKPGWYSTEVSRAAALDAFEDAHRKGRWSTYDAKVIGELATFVVKNGKPQASSGDHDDLILASAIGWVVMTTVAGAPGYDDTARKWQAKLPKPRM